MSIERYDRTNRDFPLDLAPDSDGRWVLHEDHLAALEKEKRVAKGLWDQQENRIEEYAAANTSQKHRIRELEAALEEKDAELHQLVEDGLRELTEAGEARWHDERDLRTATAIDNLRTKLEELRTKDGKGQ